MSRRLAVTPTQLRGLLEVLTPFGFTAAKIEVTTSGSVILHSDAEVDSKSDALSEWEASRGRRPH